ncbi:hypothetical protein [Nocardia sp. NPDC004604]|uniref:hypothetical protein n=1 Tax=Nocardia sp. NPDC004604 TaxID=3157013 RepID=UPI0033ADE7E9
MRTNLTQVGKERRAPVGICARISRDYKGIGRGVERQIKDDLDSAKSIGGTVVAIYVDTDMSLDSQRDAGSW